MKSYSTSTNDKLKDVLPPGKKTTFNLPTSVSGNPKFICNKIPQAKTLGFRREFK